MNRRGPIFLVFATCLLVAACSADDIVISGTGSRGLPYDPSIVRYVISQGDMPLEVHGNPSNLPDRSFVELVESSLKIDPFFGSLAFRTQAKKRNAHSFRVVLVFSTTVSRVDPRRICRRDLPADATPGVALYVAGAFCDRDKALSGNTALTNLPSTFDDPIVQRLLDQLILEMLPPEGKRNIDESCPPPTSCS